MSLRRRGRPPHRLFLKGQATPPKPWKGAIMYRKQSRNQSEQQARRTDWRKIDVDSLPTEMRAHLDEMYGLLDQAKKAKEAFAAAFLEKAQGRISGLTADNLALAFRFGPAFRILSEAELKRADRKKSDDMFSF